MLSIKHSSKSFFRIDIQKLNNLSKDSKEIIGFINVTWSDIERLNYLFHKNMGQLVDDPEMEQTFSALIVFGDSFYTHLSTIYLLMKQLGDNHAGIKKLLSLNEKFLEKRIQVIRNCILIHKEKSFYKKPLGSMSSTDPSHFIEHKVMVISPDGQRQVYTLKPLKDVYLMSRLLINLESLLIGENTRLQKDT